MSRHAEIAYACLRGALVPAWMNGRFPAIGRQGSLGSMTSLIVSGLVAHTFLQKRPHDPWWANARAGNRQSNQPEPEPEPEFRPPSPPSPVRPPDPGPGVTPPKTRPGIDPERGQPEVSPPREDPEIQPPEPGSEPMPDASVARFAVRQTRGGSGDEDQTNQASKRETEPDSIDRRRWRGKRDGG